MEKFARLLESELVHNHQASRNTPAGRRVAETTRQVCTGSWGLRKPLGGTQPGVAVSTLGGPRENLQGSGELRLAGG